MVVDNYTDLIKMTTIKKVLTLKAGSKKKWPLE